MSKANFCLCLKILHKSVFRIVRDNGYSVGRFQKCYQCEQHNLDNAVFDGSCIPRPVLNHSYDKWPVTLSLTRSWRDHPATQPPLTRAGGEGPVRGARKHLATKALVAWDRRRKICSPIAARHPSDPEVRVMPGGNCDRYALCNAL